jgi:hypothetical protein
MGYVIDRRQGDLVAVYGYYLDDLPSDYLPQPNIVHDETLRPDWEAVPQSYLIDQNWDAKLFSDIERINVNAAAFAHFTQPGTTRTFPQGLLRMHYDGGFPIMHVFNGIRSSMPELAKPKTTALAAASPGVLTLESPADTAEMVQRALSALPRSRVAFDAVHNWSRLKPSAAAKVPPVARETLVRLCSLLGVRPEALLQPFNTEEEEKMSLLVAGKLIASYYRMLWRVLQPNPRAEYIGNNIQVDEEPDVFSYDDFPEDDDEDDF